MASSALKLFEGNAPLAIIDALKSVDAMFEQLLSGKTAEEFLKAITRQQLLDYLSGHGLRLDSVLPINWEGKEDEKQLWLKKMSNDSFGISVGGNIASREMLLETYIRLEALRELCMPPQPGKSDKMSDLRKKYRAC
ncbi:MAG: hypothetical protein AAF939_16630 [Planctomycetota bacterium]